MCLSEVFLGLTYNLFNASFVLFLLNLGDLIEILLFKPNTFRFSLDSLDFKRDIVLLRDKLLVLLGYLLHLLLVKLLLRFECLVIRIDLLGCYLLRS